MKYTIVALPEKKTLLQLNTIRNYFYTHNFRYTNAPLKGVTHITLSQLELSEGFDIQGLKNILQIYLKNFQPFILSRWEVVNQEHKRVKSNPEFLERYPHSCGWIALLFQNNKLISLSQSIIQITTQLWIDISLAYAQNIAWTKGRVITTSNDIYEYLANHMNICNYVRLEKADEAMEYFLQHFIEKEIEIRNIALISEEQEILWEINL